MISLPLTLFPRNRGLTTWIEHLADGVLELAPFASTVDLRSIGSGSIKDHESDLADSGSSGAGGLGGKTNSEAREEKVQGMVQVHKLPVISERGQAAGRGEDLAFALGRKRFVIKPFHLPPVDGDQEAQKADSTKANVDMDF